MDENKNSNTPQPRGKSRGNYNSREYYRQINERHNEKNNHVRENSPPPSRAGRGNENKNSNTPQPRGKSRGNYNSREYYRQINERHNEKNNHVRENSPPPSRAGRGNKQSVDK